MTNPANEIEILFSRIAEDPTSPQPGDIDELISYYRKMRGLKESGVKPKKDTGPKPKIDLAALGLPSKPAASEAPSGFKRRV